MRKILQIVLFTSLIILISDNTYSQVKKLSIDDQLLQDSIYKSNKKKVLNFSMREFDSLFFEYFNHRTDSNVVLSRKDFYAYTVQIAIFSDRLAKLYPDQKEVAAQNKEKWLLESYEDYLQYKASQKK
ncbi:hypothetical protein BC749_101916 [Flavobacterium araucananum]|jgi:hypothetical protein|uniref:Uncharacterized protein n=1 Tax=Flavobacterium araucananum TaxID=946678 RepID=A0A227PHR7_9FLAO|nr:hypothetical protein [Flavobacterium araucananum]OXG09450.1 hypothetical protein B0A64_01455 [Flavobacterium araucananum]PWK02836.1 hypothetical protein BC749_101916 [Flavobacterium araucananum]